MGDFTSSLTKAATVADSVITLWNEGVIISAQEAAVMDQFANVKEEAQAKMFQFTKFSALTPATTALTDGEDPTSEALADTAIQLTPAEYGNVVSTTSLANLQSGGKVDRAALQLIGLNLAQTKDMLAIQALEASANTISDAAEASIASNNVITATLLEKAYRQLRKNNVMKFPGFDAYVAVMHPDVAYDLKAVAAAGDWTDVNKYAQPDRVLKGVIGYYKGFYIVESSNVSINADAGAAAVDTYYTSCFGFNALGLGISQAPGLRVTGPFDKLGRIMNLGWYGVFKYGLIDTVAACKIITASSVGANT